jgi:hypothetical protein
LPEDTASLKQNLNAKSPSQIKPPSFLSTPALGFQTAPKLAKKTCISQVMVEQFGSLAVSQLSPQSHRERGDFGLHGGAGVIS